MNKILARKIRDSRNITKGSLVFIEIYQLVDKENHAKIKFTSCYLSDSLQMTFYWKLKNQTAQILGKQLNDYLKSFESTTNQDDSIDIKKKIEKFIHTENLKSKFWRCGYYFNHSILIKLREV